jgi:drug/metabolite transporter (DMT)-like permease
LAQTAITVSRRLVLIKPDEAAAVFAQINAENCDFHGFLPYDQQAASLAAASQKGRAIHKGGILQQDRLSTVAIILVTACCAAWGVQQVAIKMAAANGLPPVFQAALRSAGAAVFGLTWLSFREGRAGLHALLRPAGSWLPRIAIAALFAGEFIFIYLGLGLTTASRAALFVFTAPFFTALGAQIFLPHDKMRGAQALGLLIAFAGVAATFAEGLLRGHGNLLGDALCVVGAVLWAATSIIIKASRGLIGTTANALLVYQLCGSAPVLLVASILLGELSGPLHVGGLAWLSIGYQAFLVAFLSYLTWFWLLLIYPASRLASFTFLTPVFGVAAGWALLGEPLSPGLFVGLTAIGLGLRLINHPSV